MMGKVKNLMIEREEYNNVIQRSKSDALLQLEHKLGYRKDNPMYECRYEERDGDYTLKQWRDGHETASRGLLQDLPEWLASIRSVAVVGGHLKAVRTPPPDNIVWFTTDDDGNLINFMELT
jgi:hypothetical protein